MSISASTFSDPSMRPQLHAYYEKQKAEAVEAWKSRPESPDEVKMVMPDGSVQTGKAIRISAEKMEKAIVSFDKWLEFQAGSFDNGGFGPKSLAQAEKRIADMQQHSPDTSSNVRTTFARDGALLAYVNNDGSVAASNGGEKYVNKIVQKANDMNLNGQARVDYLNREIRNALSEKYDDLKIASYTDINSPTKREFSAMWHKDFDIDQNYSDAMKEANAHLETVKAWHQQWQKNMNEIQNFLLSYQEQSSRERSQASS